MISPRFLKFCIVGGLGFLTDTALLVLIVDLTGMIPALAKVLSFAFAVLVTFECNRSWSFGDATRRRRLTTFPAYLGVQATGFVVNCLVFGIIVALLPAGNASLVGASAAASAAGLAVNFLGASRFVFAGRAAGRT